MALFGNTFFWTFFFMIGFVATVELIEDLGPQVTARWIGRTLDAAWLLVAYVLAVLLFVRMLRLFGTTYSWTANALRNGALLYISTKMRDRKAMLALLGLSFLSFWPFWDWNWLALGWFALTLVALGGVNAARGWLMAREWRLLAVIGAMSLFLWAFDAYAYHTAPGATLSIALCFWLVQVLARGYDRLLVYRKKRMRELQYDTQHDSLTGALSRAKFTNDLTRWRELRIHGQIPPVHLAMLDIDHFKAVNDGYGHLVGDEVLRAFSHNWLTYIDSVAYPCALYRTGGEEFSLIVAGGADDAAATAILTGYLEQLRDFTVATSHGPLHLSVSAGLTAVQAGDTHNEQVIGRADAHLYTAKRAGRARLVTD